MNLNPNNEKKTSREINIETANKKICDENNLKLSQKNLKLSVSVSLSKAKQFKTPYNKLKTLSLFSSFKFLTLL